MFDALDFLAELTQHIPPKGTQLIRRYGLYSSRIKARWEEMDYIADRAPHGWRAEHDQNVGSDHTVLGFSPFSDSVLRQSTPMWLRPPLRTTSSPPVCAPMEPTARPRAIRSFGSGPIPASGGLRRVHFCYQSAESVTPIVSPELGTRYGLDIEPLRPCTSGMRSSIGR